MQPKSFLPKNQSTDVEPRWPVLLALAAVMVLHFALPPELTPVPTWVWLVAFAVLVALLWFFHSRGEERVAYVVGLILISAVTAGLILSLLLLIASLPSHNIAPLRLLQAAASLWISNVLVFAAWYWKLDAGGPYLRARVTRHENGAFLFPQMALHEESPAKPDTWHPRFMDYLFLSFNTSTALSPTDTQIFSRWAKGLMMLQSVLSLTIIALLAARAVNIL